MKYRKHSYIKIFNKDCIYKGPDIVFVCIYKMKTSLNEVH